MRYLVKRLPALIAGLIALAALAATPAPAFWSAGGTGAGQAAVDTLPAANQPLALATLTNVTVRWSQNSFQGRPLGTYAGGGYLVRRYPADGGAGVSANSGCDGTIAGTAATVSCDEAGAPAGSWQYTVTPVLGSWTGAESPRSAVVVVATGAPALRSVTPQDPAAAQSTGDVKLTWNAVVGATGYNVYRRPIGGSYDFSSPLNGAVPLVQSTYTDSGAGSAGATTYAYVVRAVTLIVESASSNEMSATAIARPSAPTSVTAVPAPSGQMQLSWPSVSGASGYNVYRRTATGAYNYASPVNGATPVTATAFTDTTSTTGTTYRYVVRATGTGAGGSRLESFDSPESAAATADGVAPTSVTLTNPGSPLRGVVTLSGGASDTGSGVASLRFQYAAAGGSTSSTACTATSAPYSCAWTTTAVADGVYDLRVVATDAAGNATTSAVAAGRRVDNTSPAVTLNDPGAYVRGSVTLNATATDTGSGLTSLVVQGAPTGSNTWTTICSGTTSPANCAWNTTTFAEVGYDLRAVATDAAGNTATSLLTNRVVDNTAPKGVDIQTTNAAGGTAGKAEPGDALIFTFSEPMRTASILAGWTGGATTVVVRITQANPNDVISVLDATNTTQLALGTVNAGKKYVTATTTFTASTMVAGGSTVVVTLGTPNPANAPTVGASATLQWTTSSAATDLAGNPLTATTVAEAGSIDLDF